MLNVRQSVIQCWKSIVITTYIVQANFTALAYWFEQRFDRSLNFSFQIIARFVGCGWYHSTNYHGILIKIAQIDPLRSKHVLSQTAKFITWTNTKQMILHKQQWKLQKLKMKMTKRAVKKSFVFYHPKFCSSSFVLSKFFSFRNSLDFD